MEHPRTGPGRGPVGSVRRGRARGRRALVVGPSSDPRGWDTLYGQWFTGPPGAEPADLVADSAVLGLGELESVSAVSHDGSGLVVLTAPGDTVEVSPRVVVGTDGSVRRDFTTAGTVDGLLVTPGTVALAEVVSTNGATRTFEVLPGGLSMSSPPPGADRVRFDGPTGRIEQAIVSSERQIVDREGRRAED